MGMRRNRPPQPADLNLDPHVGAGLPPLEFKGKRSPPRKGQKRREKERDAKGRRRR